MGGDEPVLLDDELALIEFPASEVTFQAEFTRPWEAQTKEKHLSSQLPYFLREFSLIAAA